MGVTKVARGRFARALVFRGKYVKTRGGLTQEMLTKNKRGKIVSKRASAHGMRAFKRVEGWLEAVMTARKALHTKGFVAINGSSLTGKALYVKAKSLYRGVNVGGPLVSSPGRPLASATP